MTLINNEVGRTYKHSKLTDLIIGVFYEVYNELGFGFLESVYRNALQLALIEKQLVVMPEKAISVYFRGNKVGDFRADLVVNDLVLLELKTAEAIAIAHEAQLLNYLRSTTLEIGLILNFGPKPQVRRLLFDNDRKQSRAHRAGSSY
jgi:GxxExxY protein